MKMEPKKFRLMDHDLQMLFNGCVEPCTQCRYLCVKKFKGTEEFVLLLIDGIRMDRLNQMLFSGQ
jgi:hypothetical protein